MSPTFGWEVCLLWVQCGHGVCNASPGINPWHAGLALLAAMEAVQRLQTFSCLWKAAAELAETVLTLLLQLQAAPFSGFCVWIRVCKLHLFLLLYLHPSPSTESSTTSIFLLERDTFICCVRVGMLGPASAWHGTKDRGTRSRINAGKLAGRIFALNTLRNGHNMIRGNYTQSRVCFIFQLETVKALPFTSQCLGKSI